MIRVAINGLGRIGRRFLRLSLEHPQIEVVAINDIANAEVLAHLLKFDSIFGVSDHRVEADSRNIIINDKPIPLQSEDHPKTLNWRPYNVDFVLESSGRFKNRKSLEHHINNGAKRVILSVPPEDHSIPMIVLGVNDDQLDSNWSIVSNASCTTNNAAPMIAVMRNLCRIESAYITTVHSFTADQNLQDAPHRDLRRARSATQSIIPTTTGAAKALTHIFEELSWKTRSSK